MTSDFDSDIALIKPYDTGPCNAMISAASASVTDVG